MACEVLVPPPGVEPAPPALAAQSLNHWTSREAQLSAFYNLHSCFSCLAALSSPQEEEEAGFTGRRMNSKMQVYSGSKCAYLPKMMTLHEQCIRVLKNNIDSIFEVGGVPYSVLEPVLERCTPDQLYRIEEYNHVSVLLGWQEGSLLACV